MKRELKPISNLSGKLVRKSLISFREVSIERNIMRAVTEKHRPINEHIANDSNEGSAVSVLTPPGTVVDVAKELKHQQEELPQLSKILMCP